MANLKTLSFIFIIILNFTLVIARRLDLNVVSHDHHSSGSDPSKQLIDPSSLMNDHQFVNHSTTIIDKGIHDQDADFASDIIALIFSTLSVFSTVTILILFYLEQSWVFGNEIKFMSKKQGKDSLNYSVQIGNRVQQKRQVINKKKRQFIRRCMLALLIADLISSLSRILFILWWWVCSRIAPDVMFNRSLVPLVTSNQTSVGMNYHVQNHVSIQLDSNPMTISQPSIPSVVDFILLTNDNSSLSNMTTLIAVYELKAGATIVNRLFAHVNFAASLSTATWCVIVAFAIYATTTNVKWMEQDTKISENLTYSSKIISSFSNSQQDTNDCATDNSEMNESNQDTSNMSEHLVSIDLRQSNQSTVLHTSQLHQHKFHEIASFNNRKDQSIDLDSSAPKRNSVFIEKLKKMTPFRRYEISFHIVAWGVGLFVFLMLFIFRFVTTFENTAKKVKTGFVVSIYISWNIYFTTTVIVNFIILIMIWRYVGRYINSTQLQVIPKKETKRRQLSVILRLSLLILPYVICGVFEVAYWYYNICAILMDTDDDTFILVFYNFFFNGLVPLRGFFFGIAFLLGSSEIRSFVKYIICCGYCCYNRQKIVKNPQLSESLLNDDPNASKNFQALIVESSTDSLIDQEQYHENFREIRKSNSGSVLVDQSSSPNGSSSSSPNNAEYYKSITHSGNSKLRSGTMKNSPITTHSITQDVNNLEQVTFGRLDSGISLQSNIHQQTKKRARTFIPNYQSKSNTSSVGSPQSSPVGPNSPRLLKSSNSLNGDSISIDLHKITEN